MKINKLLLSCFGLGFMPKAPGTFGSVLPVVIFAAAHYAGMQSGANLALLVVMITASSVLCVPLASAAEKDVGLKDPGWIVIDEFAGQSVALLPLAFVKAHFLWLCIAAFLLFRLFDILKPYPIKKAENLGGGLGILADDLLAGGFAAAILLVVIAAGLNFSSLQTGELNLMSAVILGAVQGLTEFLPVSSSGHLVLLEKIFGFQAETPQMLLSDLLMHTGTVAAILIVFRKSIVSFLKRLFVWKKYGNNWKIVCKRNPSIHLVFLAACAIITTGIIGIILKEFFESVRASLATVVIMWLINATVLLATDAKKKTHLNLRSFTFLAAVLVGLAQTAAIMPGISRSGATICAAVLLGLHRRWAVEFSFLIAIPIILGATLLEIVSSFDVITNAALPVGAMLAGVFTAAIVGILALKILIKVSRQANLKIFAVYCYLLAAVVGGYLIFV